jgi:hypothetical protein
VVAAVAATAPFLVGIRPAGASGNVSASPIFPTSSTVGQTGIPASISIGNNSTAPESGGNLTVTDITLVPSCGSLSFGDCPAANDDPGVYAVSAATGEPGTACAGMTFTVTTIVAAQGKLRFTPPSAVVLGPPGGLSAVCRIDFTIDIVKMPVKDSDVGAGMQTAHLAAASWSSAVSGASGTGFASSETTVSKAQPTIATSATATVAVGSSASDSATLSSGVSPTGTVTFNLFGPSDLTCAGPAVFTSTVPITGNTTVASGSYVPTVAGSYHFIATYNGDPKNNSAAGACGDSGETVTVTGNSGPAQFNNLVTGQASVDTTMQLNWAASSSAQGYKVTIGTVRGGAGLVNSGALPASQNFFALPVALPSNGQTLWARLSTLINGTYAFASDIVFTAAPGRATFLRPLTGQTSVDTTQAFAWSAAVGTGVQGYRLSVGTAQGGTTILDASSLPATQNSMFMPNLPSGTLWARVWTKVNGSYSRFQDVSFTAAPGQAAFTNPTQGQTGVATTGNFTWSPASGAGIGGYSLLVGTTTGSSNLVNSGTIPVGTTSFHVSGLPAGQTLHARIRTIVNGVSNRFQDITFTTA